jgi:pimeloyl-ACP methyl ester carboxylesterase
MSDNADVVVVIPGIMGSSLIDGNGHEVWGLSGGALFRGLLTLAGSIRRLQLPDGIGDEHPGDGVTAGRLLPDLHVIPGLWTISIGYSKLLTHLQRTHSLTPYDPHRPEQPANLIPFPYDWRLSNRYNARRLKSFIEPALERWRAQPGCADARLILVCHSMGGLVARWYVDNESGAEHTRAVITLGTPHRGAAVAVGNLVNGVRKGLGPLAVDLTAVVRSLPSLHQMLPEYACVEGAEGLRTPTEARLPELSTALVADGARFLQQLNTAHDRVHGYEVHPLVGFRHPTATTVRLSLAGAEMIRTIEDADEKGDGTVPRLSAAPKGTLTKNPAAVHYTEDTHTALPGNKAAIDQIDGIMTTRPVEHLAAEIGIGITADDIVLAGETIVVRAETEDPHIPVHARLTDAATGIVIGMDRMLHENGRLAIGFADVPPGAYQVTVGWGLPSQLRDPVTTATLVADAAALREAYAATPQH